MQKLTSLAEYKELTVQARENQYIHTNCYLMSAAAKQKIADGCLYVQQLEKGLLILELDKNDFYRVYYYLAPDFNGSEVHLDKDAVIEFPFVHPLEADAKKKVEPALIEKLGFTLGRESAYLNGNLEKLQKDPGILPQNITLRTARPEEAEKILELFSSQFDCLYSFLSTADELRALIEKQRVFVACKGDVFAGAVSSDCNRRYALGGQIAIDSAFRGFGIGKALMAFYHAHYYGQVEAVHTWVDIKNTVSVNMHNRLGYEIATPPRRANEYIRRANGCPEDSVYTEET